jgi:hypothetical protein
MEVNGTVYWWDWDEGYEGGWYLLQADPTGMERYDTNSL